MPSNWLYVDTNFPTFTGEETVSEKVTTIQNYMFMLVEQLRYTLHNLDLSNMNAAAVQNYGETLTEPIYAQLESEEGNIASLAFTAEALSLRLSDTEGNVTALQTTADGLSTRVSSAEGSISVLQQTADSLASQIGDANGNISALQQTASSLATQISNANGNISALQQTASTLATQISNTDGKITALQQTVNGFSLSAYDNGSYTTLSLTSNGVTISSARMGSVSAAASDAGDALDTVNAWTYPGSTYIDGSMLMTGTVIASTLQGGTIGILNSSGYQIGYMSVGSSTSTGLQLVSDGNLYLASASCDIQMMGYYMSVSCASFYPRGSSADLGDSGLGMWQAVYAYTGTIQTSDLTKKHDVIYGLDAYDAFFDSLRPISFLFNDGTSGRRHHGLGAQDVEQALLDCGLTSMDFAGLIKSPRLDDEGQAIDGKYDYALRYAEFIPMLIDQVQRLKARVGELEASV